MGALSLFVFLIVYFLVGGMCSFIMYEFINENLYRWREDVLFGTIMFWPIAFPTLIGLMIHKNHIKDDDN